MRYRVFVVGVVVVIIVFVVVCLSWLEYGEDNDVLLIYNFI